MQTSSLFDHLSDELKNRKHSFIDLTKPLDNTLETYSSQEYSDPELEVKTWCSYMERGFRVSRIKMGSQTGTHIDAPAHFIEGGEFMERLRPDELMGRYYYIDAAAIIPGDGIFTGYNGEQFIFISGSIPVTELPEGIFMQLLELPAKIWIAAGEFTIKGRPEFFFNRSLAEKGKFLVENLDLNAVRSVTGNGYAFALPLKLMDTPGAPCRLIVLPDQDQ